MKKNVVLILIFCMALALTACSESVSSSSFEDGAQSQYQDPISISGESSTKIITPSITTLDYLDYSIDRIVGEYAVYCNYVNYSEKYIDKKPIQIDMGLFARDSIIWAVFGSELIYFVEPDNTTPSAIYKYSFDTKRSEVVFTMENEHYAQILAEGDDSIVWLESTSNFWEDAKLHYLDIKQSTDIVFFEYPLSDTGRYSFASTNPCVIYENTIYYDRYELVDTSSNDFTVNLYAFNILDSSTTLIDEQAQGPFIYEDKVFWYKLDIEHNSTLLVSKDEMLPFAIDLDSSTMIRQGQVNTTFFAIYDCLNTPVANLIFDDPNTPDYGEKDKLTTSAYGVRVFANGSIKPVTVTNEQIGSLVSNNDVVSWGCEEHPHFYLLEEDLLINVDVIPPGYYSASAFDGNIFFTDYRNAIIYMVEY